MQHKSAGKHSAGQHSRTSQVASGATPKRASPHITVAICRGSCTWFGRAVSNASRKDSSQSSGGLMPETATAHKLQLQARRSKGGGGRGSELAGCATA
eukprot:1159864-Pelagomonas_calceolata.AAC.12